MRYSNLQHCTLLKHIENKKGSVMLESIIFLPVFIIVIMSVAFVINIYSIQMQVNHHLTEECISAIPKLYCRTTLPEFEYKLKNRVKSHMGDKLSKLNFSKIDIYGLIYDEGISVNSKKINVNLNYEIKNPFPINYFGKLKYIESVRSRGFIGEENQNKSTLSYEDLEKDEGGGTVYVFPNFGSKFHGENCRCVKSYPKESLLTHSIRRKYSSCKLCNPSKFPNGTKIFISDTSKIFHSSNCTTVSKSYIKMLKKDAESSDYVCCEICGGK